MTRKNYKILKTKQSKAEQIKKKWKLFVPFVNYCTLVSGTFNF